MTDPIADMLTRIRNAQAVHKAEVVLPMSKVKFGIAKVLEAEGWIEKAETLKESFKTKSGSKFDQLRVVLKYNGKKPHISSLKRISRPGLRIYVKSDEMPRVLNNLGVAIISTSQGFMTNKEARRKKIGGEVICEIY